MREKNALREQLYNQQSRVNAIDKITGFLNQYLTQSEENKRFQAEQKYRQDMLNENIKQTGIAETEARERTSMEQRKFDIEYGKPGEEGLRQQESKARQQYYSEQRVGQPKYYKTTNSNGDPTIVKIDESGNAVPIYTGKKSDKLPITPDILEDYLDLKDSTYPSDIKRCNEYERLWPALKGVNTYTSSSGGSNTKKTDI